MEKENLTHLLNTFDFNIFKDFEISDTFKHKLALHIIDYVKKEIESIEEYEKISKYLIDYETYKKGIAGSNYVDDFKNELIIRMEILAIINKCYQNFDYMDIYLDRTNNAVYVNTWRESYHNGDSYDNRYNKIPIDVEKLINRG